MTEKENAPQRIQTHSIPHAAPSELISPAALPTAVQQLHRAASTLNASNLQQLQRTVGNRTVSRSLEPRNSPHTIQRKFTTNQGKPIDDIDQAIAYLNRDGKRIITEDPQLEELASMQSEPALYSLDDPYRIKFLIKQRMMFKKEQGGIPKIIKTLNSVLTLGLLDQKDRIKHKISSPTSTDSSTGSPKVHTLEMWGKGDQAGKLAGLAEKTSLSVLVETADDPLVADLFRRLKNHEITEEEKKEITEQAKSEWESMWLDARFKRLETSDSSLDKFIEAAESKIKKLNQGQISSEDISIYLKGKIKDKLEAPESQKVVGDRLHSSLLTVLDPQRIPVKPQDPQSPSIEPEERQFPSLPPKVLQTVYLPEAYQAYESIIENPYGVKINYTKTEVNEVELIYFDSGTGTKIDYKAPLKFGWDKILKQELEKNGHILTHVIRS